ncbi:hypothetical protein GCM10009827_040830 [Dactylosporangium maewongense]|uniref:DUF2382 domain-containing protein n=1 Tax=Dactylosporangium maewongense TaxID=634393 RepID=A0ABP4LF85_9ACTN
MAPVDEDRQLDHPRPAEILERVEGRADRAAGEEDVVDEDHAAPVEATGRDLRVTQRTGRLEAKIVPIERDVQHTHRDLSTLESGDPGGESASERYASGRYAEQHRFGGSGRLFQNLMGNPVHHTGDICRR